MARRPVSGAFPVAGICQHFGRISVSLKPCACVISVGKMKAPGVGTARHGVHAHRQQWGEREREALPLTFRVFVPLREV